MTRAAKAYHQTLPHLTKDNWREHAAAKREQRDGLIPTEWRLSPDVLAAAGDNVTGVPATCGILSAKELEITELDEVEEVRSPPPSANHVGSSPTLFLTQLAKRIADKTYTAVEVATAFSKRAAVAQQLTNCSFRSRNSLPAACADTVPSC